MRDSYYTSRKERKIGIMATIRTHRDNRLEILQHPDSEQALDDLTNKEFARQVNRGIIVKKLSGTYDFAKVLITPAAIGAGWGALTGDFDAVKEGAYYGVALGTVIQLGYAMFAALPRKLSGSKPSLSERKERIAEHIKNRLQFKMEPIRAVLSNVTILPAIYFGISLGVDLIVPTDNIFNAIKVDNGLAVKIGITEGLIDCLLYVNAGRKWYGALQQRISEISGIVE